MITLDRIGWEAEDIRSTTAHEIGHLLDFAAYGNQAERRDGLGSEAWAECAAVDAGFRTTDSGFGDTAYHCTDTELEQYQFSLITRFSNVHICDQVQRLAEDGSMKVRPFTRS